MSGVTWAGACGMGRNERGEGGSERRELGPCGKRVGLGFGPVWVGFRVLGWFEMVWAFELDGLWV